MARMVYQGAFNTYKFNSVQAILEDVAANATWYYNMLKRRNKQMASKPVDTAIVMVVGPLVDDTDFKSLEESIAYNAAGMDISLVVEKTDGTTAVTAITLTTAGANDWVHTDGGYYSVEITAAQNIEEGVGFVRGICDGVLVFESPRYDMEVANVYDSLRKGTDKLQVDTTQIEGADATTQINDQVVDVMKTDTTSEMSQGAPPPTPTFEEMVAYLYFKMRNKGLTTVTEDAMYDDAGTTKLMKATLSDNGTTFEKSEYISGA